MPLYEYECDACGGRFEVIQKFSEVSEECRRCGKGPVRRLVSSPAFQFKGTGWYVTDYAQKGKTDGDRSDSSEKSSEKSSDKSDTGGKSDKGEKKSDSGGDSATKSAPAATAASTKE